MFKLVIVGGKLRGDEFVLEDGDNIIGRDPSCSIALDIAGVSKQHLKLTVRENNVFLEDLGSSNGTFVNGKLVQRIEVEHSDRIAIPDCIIQVVYVKEKKIIVKKQVVDEESGEEVDDDYLSGADTPPEHPVGKIIHFFKYKFMSYIHGFNEEYEWRIMFGVFLSIFIVVTVALTVSPVLQSSKKLLVREIAKRGAHYADEVSRLNAKELSSRQFAQLNTSFLNNEDGIVSYELFDLEGHIYAPEDKQGDQIKDIFSIDSQERFLKIINAKRGIELYRKFLYDQGDMQIGIAQLINAYNVKTGTSEPVGIIAIRFQPSSLVAEAAQNSQAFLESLSISAIIAILFFGIVYYLTLRPIDELRIQIEDVMRGKRKEIEGRLLMAELAPLKGTINALLQKLKELSSEDGESEFNEIEDDGEYVRILGEFLEGAGGPAMILNSEKLVERINMEAEDLIGLRESSTMGSSLMDTAREKGFAATIMDLCDQSANAEGTCQKGNYEITGNEYEISVMSLIGRDGFAKAYYITFARDN